MNDAIRSRIARVKQLTDAAHKDFPTRHEVATTIAEVVKSLKELSSTLTDAIKAGDDVAIAKATSAILASKELKGLQSGVFEELPAQISALAKRLDGVAPMIDGRVSPLADRIAKLKVPELAKRVSALENEEKIEGPDEETPESIRNKLESLKGTPSALAINAIFGLSERLDTLQKSIERNRGGSGGPAFAYSRGAIKLYDLSDQLDGSKKTFAMPAFWRIISIQSTSSPTTFRPGIDYTSDGNAMTVTFTSEIDATSTLSAGQTLTVIYAEP